MARFPFYLFGAIIFGSPAPSVRAWGRGEGHVLIAVSADLEGHGSSSIDIDLGAHAERLDTWTTGPGCVIEGHRILAAEVVGNAFTDDLSCLGSFLALDVGLTKQPELFEQAPR